MTPDKLNPEALGELYEALEPFARMNLSTEPEVSDCLLRSAGEEMRRAAARLDERDEAIRRARIALAKARNPS